MVGIRQEHRRQAIKSDHTVGLGIGNRLHKILAPQALVVGMMAERERHRDAKLFGPRSEEHTSELQSLMRNSYAVFCLKKKNKYKLKEQHTKGRSKTQYNQIKTKK